MTGWQPQWLEPVEKLQRGRTLRVRVGGGGGWVKQVADPFPRSEVNVTDYTFFCCSKTLKKKQLKKIKSLTTTTQLLPAGRSQHLLFSEVSSLLVLHGIFPPLSPNTQEALRGTNIHTSFQTFHTSSVKDIASCHTLRKTAVATAYIRSIDSFFTCYTKKNLF